MALAKINERIISAVWRDQPWAPYGVRGVRGELLEVLHPGRENGGPGPDFKDAHIRFPDGREMCGDVEIHVRSTDWDRHRHDRNPAYNNVILHVTYLCDIKSDHRKTSANGPLPELELGVGYSYYIELERLKQEKYTTPGITTNFNAPCNSHLHRLGPRIANGLIDQMADRRLEAKMEKLTGSGRRDIEHALFVGLARALGYSRFKENFTKIGAAAPLSLLAPKLKAINPERRVVAAQAMYLGMAGFLGPFAESGKCDVTQEYFHILDGMWCEWMERLDLGVIDEGRSWKCGGIRPANHPKRRLATLGYLAAVFAESGLLEPLEHALNEFPINGKGVGRWLKSLISSFNPIQDPYWSSRYTPTGKALKTPVVMIGKDRLLAYLINCAIPSLAHHYIKGGFAGKYARLMRIFHRIPFGGNAPEKMVANSLMKGIPTAALNSGASGAQGRLQIYEEFCSSKAPSCINCPMATYLESLPAA